VYCCWANHRAKLCKGGYGSKQAFLNHRMGDACTESNGPCHACHTTSVGQVPCLEGNNRRFRVRFL
jgi:hypothetical protein